MKENYVIVYLLEDDPIIYKNAEIEKTGKTKYKITTKKGTKKVDGFGYEIFDVKDRAELAKQVESRFFEEFESFLSPTDERSAASFVFLRKRNLSLMMDKYIDTTIINKLLTVLENNLSKDVNMYINGLESILEDHGYSFDLKIYNDYIGYVNREVFREKYRIIRYSTSDYEINPVIEFTAGTTLYKATVLEDEFFFSFDPGTWAKWFNAEFNSRKRKYEAAEDDYNEMCERKEYLSDEMRLFLELNSN